MLNKVKNYIDSFLDCCLVCDKNPKETYIALEDVANILKSSCDLNEEPFFWTSSQGRQVAEVIIKNVEDELVASFLKILHDSGNFHALSEISNELKNVIFSDKSKVSIISAKELSSQEKNIIVEKVNKITGGNHSHKSIIFSMDMNLIGGLVIYIGSFMIDMSAVAKIDKIKNNTLSFIFN